jgi:quinol monooxygenase YgiN
MIGVIAKLAVRDGKQQEFERIISELAKSVRASEPGNTFYQLCRSRGNATHYVVLEAYESDLALEQHKASAHMRQAGPKLASVLSGPPEIEVFDAVLL